MVGQRRGGRRYRVLDCKILQLIAWPRIDTIQVPGHLAPRPWRAHPKHRDHDARNNNDNCNCNCNCNCNTFPRQSVSCWLLLSCFIYLLWLLNPRLGVLSSSLLSISVVCFLISFRFVSCLSILLLWQYKKTTTTTTRKLKHVAWARNYKIKDSVAVRHSTIYFCCCCCCSFSLTSIFLHDFSLDCFLSRAGTLPQTDATPPPLTTTTTTPPSSSFIPSLFFQCADENTIIGKKKRKRVFFVFFSLFFYCFVGLLLVARLLRNKRHQLSSSSSSWCFSFPLSLSFSACLLYLRIVRYCVRPSSNLLHLNNNLPSSSSWSSRNGPVYEQFAARK